MSLEPDRKNRESDFDELFQHVDFLRALARALLRDEHRAEDVVQDAFVVALEEPPARASSVRAFLATIVRYLSSNVGRADGRRVHREHFCARAEGQASHVEVAERLETQRAVFEEVLSLAEPYRTALYLRYYEGLGPSAIAKREGLPLKTVKTRLARGLAEIRARLDKSSGGDRNAWCVALSAFAYPRGAATLAASGGALGEILIVKKLALLGIVLALAWVGWRAVDALSGPAAANTALSESGDGLVGVSPERAKTPEAERAVTVPAERRVLNPAENTEPATGALAIQLRWEEDGSPAAFIGLRVRCKQDPAPREESFGARTDEAGWVRFDALYAGSVIINLDRGPRFEADVTAGEEREVELFIPLGLDIAGTVVDAQGSAVSGAEIWMEGAQFLWPTGSLATTSGADGRFHLRSLDAGARFGARAPGSRPSALVAAGQLSADDHGLRGIQLVLGSAGGAFSGSVQGPGGRPIEGALIVAGERGGHIVKLADGSQATAATPVPQATDAAGEFTYPGDLSPGVVPVAVMARGHPVWSGEVEIVADREARLVVRLQRGGSLAGRVLDVQGRPAAGVRMQAAEEVGGGWYHHAFPPPRTTTDEEGRFELDWLPPGEQEINGHDWRRPEIGRLRSLVAIEAGETLECELQLSLGRTISGRVVDADGVGLAAWRVRARPSSFGRIYPREALTAADGGFLIANLGDANFDLSVKAPRNSPIHTAAKRQGVAPGSEGVMIVVEQTRLADARLRARLVDGDGRVPLDVELVLYPEGGTSGAFIEYDKESGEIDHGPVPAGRYSLMVQRAFLALVTTDVFELRAGETIDIGLVQLEEPGSVEVRLLGVPEEKLSWIRLTLDRDHNSTESMELDGDRFRSKELAPGIWLLRLQAGRYYVPATEVEVLAGESVSLELEASPALEARVTLVVEGSSEWSEVHLEVRDEAGVLALRAWPQPRNLVEEDGRFPALHLGAGRYTVEAWTDTGERGTADLSVDDSTRAAPALEIVLR